MVVLLGHHWILQPQKVSFKWCKLTELSNVRGTEWLKSQCWSHRRHRRIVGLFVDFQVEHTQYPLTPQGAAFVEVLAPSGPGNAASSAVAMLPDTFWEGLCPFILLPLGWILNHCLPLVTLVQHFFKFCLVALAFHFLGLLVMANHYCDDECRVSCFVQPSF